MSGKSKHANLKPTNHWNTWFWIDFVVSLSSWHSRQLATTYQASTSSWTSSNQPIHNIHCKVYMYCLELQFLDVHNLFASSIIEWIIEMLYFRVLSLFCFYCSYITVFALPLVRPQGQLSVVALLNNKYILKLFFLVILFLYILFQLWYIEIRLQALYYHALHYQISSNNYS